MKALNKYILIIIIVFFVLILIFFVFFIIYVDADISTLLLCYHLVLIKQPLVLKPLPEH